MAHRIDMSNGRANIAFRGSRNSIWHRLGTEMREGMSINDWAKESGLNWLAVMAQALVDLSGPEFEHLRKDPNQEFHQLVDGYRHVVRADTGMALGYVSDGYKPVQPSELLGWFEEYISVDPRFKLDVAGSLKGGKVIWATAVYDDDNRTIGGDKHIARLLMTTTFDGSGSTINQGTETRAVCDNTLRAALFDTRSVVKTRHNTTFNAARVGRELARIAQGFEQYKAMGDAMAQVHLKKEDIAKLFKVVLDIPFDTPKEDISSRKINQYEELKAAYATTVGEGTEPGTAWTALNAVTRYVDNDRSTRGGASADEARFLSSQFGSGSLLKSKAVNFLTEEFMSDEQLLASVSAKTDDKALLRQFGARSKLGV